MREAGPFAGLVLLFAYLTIAVPLVALAGAR